ncbi:MAG: phosphoribosylformylglycinamidine synthase [Robiginitomaculum sp.]|nr:MAG: phosphoribosylformylglycinamidine synthase [Robiginitomaculum sp.]
MASPEEMASSMIANMPEKTGKSLDEWLKIAKQSSLEKHGQIVKHLKSEHGMTHGFANLVAHHTLKCDEPIDLVAAQYAGGKASLRPIHNALVKIASGFGNDVQIAPKKTCVSLRRSKQFAVITPATKTRIDLGINLKGQAGTERLKAEKPGSMCTHKIGITDLNDLDNTLIDWLQEAYNAA